jgi:DNA-binding transcriptional MerR regulator
MLMSEVSKLTNLTKKAIEYYIEQELVNPKILDNGYRDFSDSDVECLQKIYVFRKLGLSISEIKLVLADKTNNTLQKVSVQKELIIQREQAKKAILDQLSCGKNFSELSAGLRVIDQSSTVTDKILEAFPGCYGQFICLHFAQFLNEPITTSDQQSAYEEIIAFLDQTSSFQFTEDLQSFLMESTKYINNENIRNLTEGIRQSVENTNQFLYENKEVIEQYLAYTQSEEYKNSPAYRIQILLKEFNKTSGYNDVFIPAMKRLSVSYSKYCKRLEIANEELLLQYPDIGKINNES